MASEALAVVPLVVPLVTATILLLTRRWPDVRNALSVLGAVAYVAGVAVVVWRVVAAPDAPGAVAYQVAGWPAPFGITLVVDGLSAFMLVLAAGVGLPAVLFSVRHLSAADQDVFYHPLCHLLLLGISGSFLTGDLFNLFVWFEVMLMASFVLVSFYGGRRETRATLWYLVLNVVGSALMLVAVGGLYATTGTLNMADMAERLADPAAHGVAVEPVVGLSALLFAVFALKAGLVPFHFWVPSVYTAAPIPVTALLAGAAKKVGMYAIVRLYFTVFATAPVTVALPWGAGGSPLDALGPVLLVAGAVSILVGGLGAVQAPTVEELLAYSSVGQVGFVAIPVALAATATAPETRTLGVLAGLVFALHHALAKGMLFLAAGTLDDTTGTTALAELGGAASRFPVLSGAFLVGVLSLVGIPPLSGFVGKFLVFDAAVRTGAVASGLALVVGSVLTIAYTTRAWSSAFWGEQSGAVATGAVDPLEVALVAGVALLVVGVGVGFDPVYGLAESAATAATDPEAYVSVVGPEGGGGR